MPSAFVLYLRDSVAGPSLELIRRVADPTSTSMPHVTVRYPVRKIDPKLLTRYTRERVDQVELYGPGVFASRTNSKPKTVFLECMSDQLNKLEYKPDYPDSVFHVTLYDAEPSEFAADLYRVISKYHWRLDVRLPFQTELSQIEIGNKKGIGRSEPQVTSDAAALYRALTGHSPAAREFAELSPEERLNLVNEICKYLHRNLLSVDHAADFAVSFSDWFERDGNESAGQMSLWSDNQDNELGVRSMAGLHGQRDLTRRLALYLTPPEIAHEMTRAALESLGSDRSVDFGDPAVGNGIFFASLLGLAGHPRSAIGVDVSSERIRSLNRRWSRFGFRGVATNFLDSAPQEPRSLILANPPYLRSQKLSSQDAVKWSARIELETGIKVSGRADLYAYFLLAAHKWLQEDGLGCWLLPMEFARTNYGAAVRRYLTSLVSMERIHLYDRSNSRFENARVTSAVILYRKREAVDSDVVRITTGDSMEFPIETGSVSVQFLREQQVWNLANKGWISSGQEAKVRPAPKHERVPVLGDLFRVRRGIATGANSVFVLPDEKRHLLGGEPEWYKPLIPKSRYLSSNEVMADSSGLPANIPKFWLIDTDVPLDEIARRHALLGEYLRDAQKMIGQRTLVRLRTPFYRQDQILPPPIFFGYMARMSSEKFKSRFFINRANAVILNNYLGLYPVGGLKHAFATGKVLLDEMYSAVTEIERSDIDDESRHYAAGLAKIEPSELMRIALGPIGIRLVNATQSR